MSRTTVWSAIVFALLGACGGTDEQMGAPSPEADASVSTDQSVTTIVMVGADGSATFSPANVTIYQGDRVRWIWIDPRAPFTVTSGALGRPDGHFCSLENRLPLTPVNCSGSYASTAPYEYVRRFDVVGTYPYFSLPHRGAVTGMITVLPIGSRIDVPRSKP